MVVYDESTTDPNSLSSNTTAHLVIMALSKMGNTPLLLKGLSLSSLLLSFLLSFLRVFLFKHRNPGFGHRNGKAWVPKLSICTLCQCPAPLFLSSSFFSFSSFPASTITLSSLSPPFCFILLTHLLSLCPLSPLSPLFFLC